MAIRLAWNKSFGNNYRIFNNVSQIGFLGREDALSGIISGTIENTHIEFRQKQIFSNETQIVDSRTRSVIGFIKNNPWKRSTEFSVNGINYTWRYDSFVQLSWSVYSGRNPVVSYKTKMFGGNIQSYASDYLIVLIGLYIYMKNQRSTIALFLIFLPIYLQLLTS